MNPGDRLLESIEEGIRGCKVGVAVLSPRYCESTYCLHELARMMEMKKRVVPVFYDVKPSQLRVMITRRACSSSDRRRYTTAIDKVRNIVGLTFDSSQQDWSELLREASIAVMKKLVEVEDEAQALKASYIRGCEEPCNSSSQNFLKSKQKSHKGKMNNK
ncbi:hypothetical protein SAY87_022879 [Trapa incisa]|uniref:TIR domain-containing protein n=1 Tax=Trapa incisa TaxID=236973 RepID=A0AAN7K1K5_9MYRT|nr:hypothetical protein SAY87_022879 [Trapa incisa]